MDKRKRTTSREKVQLLLSQTKGMVKLDDVQNILGISRPAASLTLWRLAKGGWVKKLKGGLYRIVPLEAMNSSTTDESPWIVATELFSPCYIGGWTAANFWGLTDQLFLNTWVMTTQKVFKKSQHVSQHEFYIKQIKESYFYGFKSEWLEESKVFISDPHKTLLDFLNFPEEYSAQSMMDIMQSYLSSEYKDISILKDYSSKVENRTILKRLGFLIEILSPEEKILINYCHENISKGYSRLSVKTKCTKSIRRWNLLVPMSFLKEER